MVGWRWFEGGEFGGRRFGGGRARIGQGPQPVSVRSRTGCVARSRGGGVGGDRHLELLAPAAGESRILPQSGQKTTAPDDVAIFTSSPKPARRYDRIDRSILAASLPANAQSPARKTREVQSSNVLKLISTGFGLEVTLTINGSSDFFRSENPRSGGGRPWEPALSDQTREDG